MILIKIISNNDFLKNVSILTFGAFFSQLISVASSPILSRVFTPNDFGMFASVMATVGVLSAIASLKLELAIITERSAFNAKQIALICYVLCTILTLFLFIFDLLNKGVAFPLELSGLGVFLSVSIFFLTGLYIIKTNELNRNKMYSLLSTSLILQRIFIVVFQFIFGYFASSYMGLILGWLIGVLISTIYIFSNSDSSLPKLPKNKLLALLRKNYQYPIYTAPQSLLNMVSNQLPIYFLGPHFGLEVVGSYWMAMRLIQLPTNVIGNSIKQVFFKQCQDLVHERRSIINLYNKTVFGLVILILPPTIIIFCYGGNILEYILGPQWGIAGLLVEVLILWIAVGFISSPVSTIFIILKRQKYNLIYDCVLLLSRVLVLYFSIYIFKLELIEVVVNYSIVGIVFNLALILIVKFMVKNTYVQSI